MQAESSHPTNSAERITSLDMVRGVAVLGILTMNAVSFGLVDAAYFNVDVPPGQSDVDWVIGAAGEVVFDQKFMALFSLLFGAGIVLFADRAEAKGRRPVVFSLWRNLLLLAIGIAHSIAWEGDVLVVYALCSPVLLAMRKRSSRTLFVAGATVVAGSALIGAIVQTTVDAGGDDLGTYWNLSGDMSDPVGLWLISDFFLRALGLMLIGVALFRLRILHGDRDDTYYRRMATWGLGIGLPVSAAGFVLVATNDFEPDVAVIGAAPNTLATIPVALGYMSLLIIWNRRDSALLERLRACGRMALTNYLTQTALGLLVLSQFDDSDLSRSWLVAFMLVVWALQLWWSTWWLERFRFGPAEWLWRVATYRQLQPIRR